MRLTSLMTALATIIVIPSLSWGDCLQGSCPNGKIEVSIAGRLRCVADNACKGLEEAGKHSADIVTLPRCGNGVCDPDENLKLCEQDCGIVPALEKACSDGLDDDRDGLVDCDDPDCGVSAECPLPAFEKNCMDGIDDDEDGAIDCDDSDCTNQPGCIVPEK